MSENLNQNNLKQKNRALLIILVSCVALFYGMAIHKMSGSHTSTTQHVR